MTQMQSKNLRQKSLGAARSLVENRPWRACPRQLSPQLKTHHLALSRTWKRAECDVGGAVCEWLRVDHSLSVLVLAKRFPTQITSWYNQRYCSEQE